MLNPQTTPGELIDLMVSTDSVMAALLDDPGGETYPMKILRAQWRLLICLLGMEDDFAAYLQMDPASVRKTCEWDVENFRQTEFVGPELPPEAFP